MTDPNSDRRPNRAAITAQLSKLGASDHFKSSKPLTAFLNFVVEEVLAGREAQIKAYTIAVSALGKAEGFDPAHDSSVRVRARELRYKLLDYYSSDGIDDDVLITIPVGTYVPVIEYRALPGIAQISEAGSGDNSPAQTQFARRIRIDIPSEGKDVDLWKSLKFELTTAISQYHELDVVSIDPAPVEMAAEGSPQETADYVLTGTEFHTRTDHYVGLQLVRKIDNAVVWSRRFKPLSETCSKKTLQNVALEMTVAIAGPTGCIARRDYRDLREIGPSLHASYRALLHAYHYLGTIARRDHSETYRQIRAALAGDPKNATLWAMLAILHIHEHAYQYPLEQDQVAPLAKARGAAMQALKLDQGNAIGWYCLAILEFEERNIQAFKRHAAQALKLHEHHALISIEIGHHLWLCGATEEGLALANSAIALHPFVPARYSFVNVHDALMRGRFEDAKRLVDQIIMPDFFWVSFLKAVINARLGNGHAAFEAARRVQALYPGFLNAVDSGQVAWVFPRGFDANVVEGTRMLEQGAPSGRDPGE